MVQISSPVMYCICCQFLFELVQLVISHEHSIIISSISEYFEHLICNHSIEKLMNH